MDSNQSTKPKSNVERIEKLTALQEGMYFYHEINPNDGVYHEQQVFHIKGAFQHQFAQTALNLLGQAHEALRTSFITLKSGEIVQVILKEREIECSVEKNEKSFEKLMQEDAQRGFDFQKDSLLRLKIVEIGEQDCYLLWSYHHIIMDGWCMSIVMGDFLRFYNALESGVSEEKLQEEIQSRRKNQASYGDYLRLIAGKDKEEALRYWKDVLEEYENVAEIPSFSLQSGKREPGIERKQIELSTELTALLRKRANEAGVTLNTILETAWGIVLQQYNHTQDAVFGRVVSGRNVDLAGAEKIVGLFINTIPCRVNTKVGESVEQLLQRMQSNDNSAEEFDYAPLAEVQAQSLVGRELIQTLFVFENYYFDQGAVEGGMEGTAIEPLGVVERTNYPIVVAAYGEKQVSVKISYDSQRFCVEEIDGVLAHYTLVLEEMGKDLTQPAEQLRMCTMAEENRILKELNNTAADYPKDKTVIDLFEEQVKKTPDNVAVVYENAQLTYAELNAKANQLARRLRSLGVKPDDFVAMLTERSLEMIVGIYGILKAGGAYVPMDPTNPEERIRYMLEDSKPKAVLTYHAQLETDIPVIDLADSQVWAGETDNLERVNTPEDLVYCIYTSGTTGKPKGVMIRNSGLINRIIWMHQRYPLQETDAVMQKTTYTFDVSVWEIIWWGIVGARVVLLKPGGEKNPEEIIKTIAEYKITHMHFVPSMLSVFLMELEDHANESDKLSSLKYVFSSGEALTTNQLERFNTLIRGKVGARLINFYGPTEASIDVTFYECEYDYHRVPIGKPIANNQIYIVSGQNLCGIGIPGELCIAGDGVARGYLNRPKLTAEKFNDNPFGKGKLYHSGDLARWLLDGNIEYLGRIDEQVKIRGFRIELGEIENCIRAIKVVKDCAVIAWADASGEKAICAYLVSDEKIRISEIRDTLAQTLPEYMIPAYITQIEKIPVTRNGKLDKRALPEIVGRSEREYVAPRNAEEEAVCEAFSEVLGIEKVGVKDNFFELGGHSLKAIWLVKKIEAKTGYKIALNDVLTSPSAEMLAALIAGGTEENAKNHENSFESLSQLTGGKNDPAIICFPFAGGFDSSYWNLSAEIHKLLPKATVYSLKYANWIDIDFNTAMKEISGIVEASDRVLLYSHCGGSGMLLKVFHNLQEKEKVMYLTIGASLPKKPKTVLQKMRSPKKPATDEQLKLSLAHAGFLWDDVPDEMEQDVLDQFRKDAESCNKDLEDLYGTLVKDTPCTVVVGDADPDIPVIEELQPRWSHYFEHPIELTVLHGANHYFHKERAVELAEIIGRCCK